MKKKPYFYYPSVGGVFRILLMKERNHIVHLPSSSKLTTSEKEFISKFNVFHYANIKPFPKNTDALVCEWYKPDEGLLTLLSTFHGKYYDRCNITFSLDDLKRAVQATLYIENKVNFYRLVKKIQPEYVVKKGQIGIPLVTKEHIKYPIIVKSLKGKGGKGNFVCFNRSDLETLPSIFHSDLFSQKQEDGKFSASVIMEPYVQNAKSYNVSYYCSRDGNVHDLSISEQIIEEVFYRGNRFPVTLSATLRKKIIVFVQEFNTHLFLKKGFFGWMGIDFIIANGLLYFIEANPRVNSVTHAHQLTHNNPFIIKLLKNVNINKLLQLSCWDYDQNIGIMPYQIFKDTFFVISSARTKRQAQIQLSQFMAQGHFETVIQKKKGNHTKSISYYLEHFGN